MDSPLTLKTITKLVTFFILLPNTSFHRNNARFWGNSRFPEAEDDRAISITDSFRGKQTLREIPNGYYRLKYALNSVIGARNAPCSPANNEQKPVGLHPISQLPMGLSLYSNSSGIGVLLKSSIPLIFRGFPNRGSGIASINGNYREFRQFFQSPVSKSRTREEERIRGGNRDGEKNESWRDSER